MSAVKILSKDEIEEAILSGKITPIEQIKDRATTYIPHSMKFEGGSRADRLIRRA